MLAIIDIIYATNIEIEMVLSKYENACDTTKAPNIAANTLIFSFIIDKTILLFVSTGKIKNKPSVCINWIKLTEAGINIPIPNNNNDMPPKTHALLVEKNSPNNVEKNPHPGDENKIKGTIIILSKNITVSFSVCEHVLLNNPNMSFNTERPCI